MIRDLDESERSEFKSSKLFRLINSRWTYSDSNVKYLNEYTSGDFGDQSVVVFSGREFYLAMISFSANGTLSFFGEPLFLVDNKDKSPHLNQAYSTYFKWLSLMKKENGFDKIYLHENTRVLSKFCDGIISDLHKYQMFIDLSQPEELIKSSIRKSYKSLINWGKRNLKIHIMDSNNLDKPRFDLFENLHLKVSGRKTRSDKTWELQYQALKDNEAFLVTASIDGVLVSGNFISHGIDTAYYGVGVNDRELMAEKLPIGHYVLYSSILCAKQKGLTSFILGYYSRVEDAKTNAITNYKKGFVNTLILEPRYLIKT